MYVCSIISLFITINITKVLLVFGCHFIFVILLYKQELCGQKGHTTYYIYNHYNSDLRTTKAIANNPVGQVLARPLFFKVTTKFHFTKTK